MDEMITVKNEGYAEYEEVLLERDNVRKEALYWEMEHTKEFGKLTTDLFEMKINCIKKKKIIAYCQARINSGNTIDQEDMLSQINQEMQEYNKELQKMIDDNEKANSSHRISTSDAARIKKIYHKLAKMLHPDINPKTDEIPELKRLWIMIVVSYNANDLPELEAAEVLVNKALDDIGWENIVIEINDLSRKIQKVKDEIIKIKGTNPYQYKFLLQDYDTVKETKDALKKEMLEYEDYAKELDQVLEQFITSGVSFKWTI